MQLLLDTRGLVVRLRNRCFHIRHNETERMIAPHRISSIAVTQPCLISSGAIRLAAQHNIPVYFFSETGDPKAALHSPRFGNLATLRRQQVYFADSPAATAWVLELFALKAHQQAELLRWLGNHRKTAAVPVADALAQLAPADLLPETEQALPLAAVRPTLLGKEGNRARAYWQAIAAALPEALNFDTRTRRPATDPFNAALNYLYGMLYTTVEQALWAAGLDPYLGLFHVDQYNAPTLAFDLIEPFRPWADRFLIERCLNQEWQADFVDTRPEKGCTLNREGKRFLIPKWNDYLMLREPFHTYQTSRKGSIYRYATELKQHIEIFPLPT
ncbi:CRISPR-associated endonuclease Cas1 [Larkinella sp. VNQ87]|uniref:CRISPR-associated endonuclease Cas1 n=1 Tax=Larkinella sp. VNQ87 TaxID=3400921 RepID=UPI003C077589